MNFPPSLPIFAYTTYDPSIPPPCKKPPWQLPTWLRDYLLPLTVKQDTNMTSDVKATSPYRISKKDRGVGGVWGSKRCSTYLPIIRHGGGDWQAKEQKIPSRRGAGTGNDRGSEYGSSFPSEIFSHSAKKSFKPSPFFH